jgi:geranylgeranyl reductase family protein
MIGQPDVIVVGAGPAGSTAARCLAERGARVILFDRARFPRDKLCGGGLTPKATRLMPEAAVATVQRWVERVEIRSRFGSFEMGESLSIVGMVERRDLDLALVEAAAARGADVRDGTAALSARVHAGVVEIATARGAVVRAAALVVADGEPSRLARSVGLESATSRRVLALEMRVPLASGIGGDRAVLGCRVPGGYAWYFPKGDHASVGVGTARPSRYARLRTDLDVFVRALGLPALPKRVQGHWIPLGLRRGLLASGCALVAGDAAGAADPLFGEGIAFALATGVLASRTVGQFLEGRAADLAGYDRAVRSTLGPRMREMSGAVRLADLSVSVPLAALRVSAWFRRFSASYVNDFGEPV